jgi:hypothetical protein
VDYPSRCSQDICPKKKDIYIVHSGGKAVMIKSWIKMGVTWIVTNYAFCTTKYI